MSQEVRQAGVQEQTQQLLQGPLKHVRAAALAAALVPVASLVATPANAQALCGSGGVCGLVFEDTNHNGIQDTDEPGIGGVTVTLSDGTSTTTNSDGSYVIFGIQDGPNTITVQIPTGYTASPQNAGGDDTIDSDGKDDGFGNSVATITVSGGAADTDFGFFKNQAANPGTGTLGYWKNHPNAWPASISIGGQTYTRDQAIYLMQRISKDRTTQMFAQLVAAKLNVGIGNDNSCIASTIAWADAWMASHPVGSNVLASSPAWQQAEPYHNQLDAYNNGQLCAPHRQ
jgi:hypothetical protein